MARGVVHPSEVRHDTEVLCSLQHNIRANFEITRKPVPIDRPGMVTHEGDSLHVEVCLCVGVHRGTGWDQGKRCAVSCSSFLCETHARRRHLELVLRDSHGGPRHLACPESQHHQTSWTRAGSEHFAAVRAACRVLGLVLLLGDLGFSRTAESRTNSSEETGDIRNLPTTGLQHEVAVRSQLTSSWVRLRVRTFRTSKKVWVRTLRSAFDLGRHRRSRSPC